MQIPGTLLSQHNLLTICFSMSSTIFGLQTSYKLGFRWLFTLLSEDRSELQVHPGQGACKRQLVDVSVSYQQFSPFFPPFLPLSLMLQQQQSSLDLWFGVGISFRKYLAIIASNICSISYSFSLLHLGFQLHVYYTI